jgi:DNA-binding IclR family transcriptional regulator/FAD/FMN-containing dehydrogenase
VSAAALGAIAGVEFADDASTLELHLQDVYASAAQPVAAVARPHDVDALQALVARAAATGTPLVPRGGGMSYTRGYFADAPAPVVVDLRGLAAIERIDADDHVAVVQAGVTWAQLREALAPHRLRGRFWGPLSGLRATIGGGVPQNAAFWGSGRYGTAADSVLGLDVVVGTGARLATGALADAAGTPFFRAYGPDPTGLFVGDGGTFGIKARVALALRAEPVAEDSLSFSFDAAAPLLAAMAEIARADLAPQQGAFDPLPVAMRTRRQSLAEDFRTLTSFLRGAKSLSRGLRDAASIVAAGRGFLEGANYLLHTLAEARGPAALREDLAAIRAIVQRHGGREVENTVAKVIAGTPFPPLNGIVGPDGERWVPVHGIVPRAAGEAAYGPLLDDLGTHEATLSRHTISCGTLFSTIGSQALLMEPMFFWPDALERLHRETLEPRARAHSAARSPAGGARRRERTARRSRRRAAAARRSAPAARWFLSVARASRRGLPRHDARAEARARSRGHPEPGRRRTRRRGLTRWRAMTVKSAERALAILDLFAREQRPLHAKAIQLALDYPASSTIGLLKTLMRAGHLRFDRRTKLYVPTLRVVLLGDWIRATPLGSDRLRRALDRVVERTGESAFLSTPNDVATQVTHIVRGPQPITLSVSPGATVPMLNTAVGQTFLATRPERELGALLRRIRRDAPSAIDVDLAHLRARLAVIRRRGWAAAYDVLPGVGAVATALPAAPDEAVSLICVGGPSARIAARERELAVVLRDCARGVRRRANRSR